MSKTKLDNFTVIQIVDRLVGPIMPTASHGADMQRLDNLEQFIDLTLSLMGELIVVSQRANSEQDSVRQLGKKAKSAIEEIKEMIGDV